MKILSWYCEFLILTRPTQNWGWAKRWNIIGLVAFHLLVISILICFTLIGLLSCGLIAKQAPAELTTIPLTATTIAVLFACYLRDLADKKQDKFMRILTGK